MSERPNILLIMADQWNAECFSGLFHTDVRTPVLDKLIENGVVFRNCFSANPICQPSRVSFLTGQYIHTHGVVTNARNARPTSVTHPLPLHLREQGGYHTGAFGKLHLGVFETDCGFDRIAHTCDNPFGEPAYHAYLREKGLLETFFQTERKPTLPFSAGQSGLRVADTNEAWTVDRTLDFVSEAGDQPFFAWCSFERPHAPHTPPVDTPLTYDPDTLTLPPYDPRYFESKAGHGRAGCENLWKAWVLGEAALRQGLAHYYALMSLIDQQLGRLLQGLEAAGKREDTLVIFTADHGDFAGNEGMLGKNTSLYDAVIRTPYLWSWPGHFDRNMPFDLCETVDLYPTLCEVIGIETPPSVQGVSHREALTDLPYFRGKEYAFSERAMSRCIRDRTHKLVLTTDGRRHDGELYDLVADPAERVNRYHDAACAPVRARLSEALIAWSIATMQPCAIGNGSQAIAPDLRWHRQFCRS